MPEPKSKCKFHVKNYDKSVPECLCMRRNSAEPHQVCSNLNTKDKTPCSDMQCCRGGYHTLNYRKETSKCHKGHPTNKSGCCRDTSIQNTCAHRASHKTCCRSKESPCPKKMDQLRSRELQNENKNCHGTQSQNTHTIENISGDCQGINADHCHNLCTGARLRQNLRCQSVGRSTCKSSEVKCPHACDHMTTQCMPHCHRMRHCRNHGMNPMCAQLHSHCNQSHKMQHSRSDCACTQFHHHNTFFPESRHFDGNHQADKYCTEKHNPTEPEKETEQGQGALANRFGIDLSKIQNILKKTDMFRASQGNLAESKLESESGPTLNSNGVNCNTLSTEYQASYNRIPDTSGVLEARKKSLKMVKERNRDSFSRVQDGQSNTLPSRGKRVSYESNTDWSLMSNSMPRV